MIRWFSRVCIAYGFQRQTFELSIDILDRYVSVDPFDLELDFKLIALTNLWIDSKFEEVRPLTMNELREFTGSVISTPRTFVEQEWVILKMIDFKLNRPTIGTYLDIYIQVANKRNNSSDPLFSPQTLGEMQWLGDLLTIDVKSTIFSYRVLATAIMLVHYPNKDFICELSGLLWDVVTV
jgi:hypothetical protein